MRSSSPAGKLMLAMLAAVAKMQRDLLVERTQSGLARAKAEGKTLGRPPKTTVAERQNMIEGYMAGTSVSALAALQHIPVKRSGRCQGQGNPDGKLSFRYGQHLIGYVRRRQADASTDRVRVIRHRVGIAGSNS